MTQIRKDKLHNDFARDLLLHAGYSGVGRGEPKDLLLLFLGTAQQWVPHPRRAFVFATRVG